MTTEHNDTTDDEPVETDGGVTNAADGADAAATEEPPARSLGELPLSRRTALKLSSAIGGTALTAGGAAATQVTSTDTGGQTALPGEVVRALDFSIDSDDEVIDVTGGDQGTDAPNPLTDNYEAVLEGDVPYLGHPTPLAAQESLPGNLLSEFSVDDRVFTNTYQDFALDADDLFQAPASADDPQRLFVEEFVPQGYTASTGIGAGCVTSLPNEVTLTDDPFTITGRQLEAFGIVVDGTDPIAYDNALANPDRVQPGDGIVLRENDSNVALAGDNNSSDPPVSFTFTLADTVDINGPFDQLSVNYVSGEPPLPADYGTVDDGDVAGPVYTTTAVNSETGDFTNAFANPPALQSASSELSGALTTIANFTDEFGTEVESVTLGFTNGADSDQDVDEIVLNGINILNGFTAIPVPGASFSTDISEVINPQLAVKVDSVGIAENSSQEGEAGIDMSSVDLPYSAFDVEDAASSLTASSASDEAILVTEDGNVPALHSSGANGYEVTYNPTPDTVDVEFYEHRTDVTLPNSGWISAVESCTNPGAGDLSPCDVDDVFEATSGLERTSQIGLTEDFGADISTNELLRIDSGDLSDVASDVYMVTTAYQPNTDDLNNSTAHVDGVATVDVPGDTLTGAEVIRQNVDGASEDVGSIAADASLNGDVSYGTLGPGENGYLQIPFDGGTGTPAFSLGDPLRIRDGDVEPDAEGGNFVSGAELDANDIRKQTDNEGVLNASDAARELELTGATVDTPDTSAVAGDLVTPVQILVEGTFKCHEDIESDFDAGDMATPIDTATVDITGEDFVSYEIISDNTDGSVSSAGVFTPASNDTTQGGHTIEVTVERDGVSVSTEVTIDVDAADNLDGSIAAAFDNDTLATYDVYTDGNAGNTGGSTVPVGEEVQVVAIGDAQFSGAGQFSGSTTLDLTRATFNGDTFVEFAVSDATSTGNDSGLKVVDAVTNDGVVSAGEGLGAESLEIEAEAVLTDADGTIVLANTSLSPNETDTATETFATRGNYYIEVAGVPGRPYFQGGEELVVTDRSDRNDVATADPVYLDDATTIASALETAINEALTEAFGDVDGYDPEVTAQYVGDNTAHSAAGYMIRSTTEVDSSFDQNVDRSSVEIGRIEELVDDGIVPEEGLDSIRGTDNALDDIERQQIETALGLGAGDFNSVTAETVTSGDVYFPRADPLNQVTQNSYNVEFLGDNQLTCNDLAFGEALVLLGGEDPDNTSELHTDNANVILFYDSAFAYNGQYGLHNDAREFGSWGAPNAVDTLLGLPGFVESDDLPRFQSQTDASLICEEGDGNSLFSSLDGSSEFIKAEDGVNSDGTLEFGCRPFVEAFDIVEVKDSVDDAEAYEENDRRLQGPRGLDEDDTVVQNVYGDRLEGVSFENTGDLQLWSSQVPEVTTIIDLDQEAPWLGTNPVEKGTAQSPPWSGNTNQPNFVPFDTSQLQDSLGRDVWFGTGLPGDDIATDDARYSETTCEVRIEDAVGIAVEAEIGEPAQEGNTLVLGIPELQDVGNDGEFVDLDDSSIDGAQDVDQGLFVESHDDQGGIATGAGEIVVDLSGGDSGSDLTDQYDSDGGNLTTTGLLDAIEDWRNDDIGTQTLLNAIASWRNR